MPLSPLTEAILTQQDTTAGCTTRINCLSQETLSSLYKVGCINQLPVCDLITSMLCMYCVYVLCVCTVCMYCVYVLCVCTVCVLCAGLLSPIGPTTVQYNISGTVTLQVNITPTATFTRDYLRALTWYYNGVQINPGSRYYRTTSLSSDNTTLNITSARGWHAGVYHVQFAGLRIYPYNKFCEEETLALLRHYPVLSPVVFNVYTNGK